MSDPHAPGDSNPATGVTLLSSVKVSKETLLTLPAMVDFLGALVMRGDVGPADYQTLVDAVRDTVQTPQSRPWNVLESALMIAETLASAAAQIAEAEKPVLGTDDPTWLSGFSEPMQAGARDVVDWLSAPNGIPLEPVQPYRDGRTALEQVWGAVLAANQVSVASVLAIAGMTRTPVRVTWRRVVPFLIEP